MKKLKAFTILYRLFGIALTCFLWVDSREASAQLMSNWDASSGVFPDQVTPACAAWTLFDNANPEDPVLGSGLLTINTSSDTENMFYIQTEPAVDTSGSFFIESRLKYISGSATDPSKTSTNILFTTAPNIGNGLFIGSDEVYFLTGNNLKGPTASVDTDDDFHTYRIDVGSSGAFTLSYDGNNILSGTTFTSIPSNGSQERILWGEASSFATGESEWSFVRHNALDISCVPEASSLVHLIFGTFGLALIQRIRRTRSSEK